MRARATRADEIRKKRETYTTLFILILIIIHVAHTQACASSSYVFIHSSIHFSTYTDDGETCNLHSFMHSFAFCLHFGLWEPSRPANYYYILLYIIIIIIDDATDRVGTERFGDTQGEGLVERWYGVTATTGSR